MKKQKWLSICSSICLSLLLAIPLYAFLENKTKGNTKSVSGINCPKESSETVMYLPHPTDCSKYIMCVLGLPVEMKCPEGLHFNPELAYCDFPENTDCTDDDW
ncbi:carbohydrate-binding module family 14 protein [Dysgonomonas mossii]|uniref:carbohydrate-binding module family 14 protein n=1 Tax=Dysgonomonas mossii TaxID=163665 RepID=UPI003996752C